MNRLSLIIVLTAVLTLTACQNKQETQAHVERPYTPLSELNNTSDTSTDWYAAGDYGSSSSADWNSAEAAKPNSFTTVELTDQDEVLAPTGGQTYQVQKGDTLYKLARRFYNDQSQWKIIWEANRARLGNPNNLRVGMKLIIP